jgi:hypothetical protein
MNASRGPSSHLEDSLCLQVSIAVASECSSPICLFHVAQLSSAPSLYDIKSLIAVQSILVLSEPSCHLAPSEFMILFRFSASARDLQTSDLAERVRSFDNLERIPFHIHQSVGQNSKSPTYFIMIPTTDYVQTML